MTIAKLLIIRHAESIWNKENRFTGWADIDLSDKGKLEAIEIGKKLKKKGYIFDYSYTSLLKRAIHTLQIILDELDQVWLPIEKTWRLNERHYGSLQGYNKDKIIKKYGIKQVKKWRRSYYSIPPIMNLNNIYHPRHDIRYSMLNEKEIPNSESLELTLNRILPFWKKNILPKIKIGQKILIVAHSNSIRAIIKFLNNLNDEEEIIKLNISRCCPIVYEFKDSIYPVNCYNI